MMDVEELTSFVKEEHQRLMTFYNYEENNQLKYPVTIKIMEELGELCEEVLSLDSIQRREKLENRQANINDEIADVLITTLILAENLNIDVRECLRNKMDKIKKRRY